MADTGVKGIGTVPYSSLTSSTTFRAQAMETAGGKQATLLIATAGSSKRKCLPTRVEGQRPTALITASTVALRKAITVKMFSHALLCVDWKLLTPIFIS